MDYRGLTETAKEQGAAQAKIISAEQITVSSKFREACTANTCGMYGRCWMCPPDIGEIDMLIAELKRYTHALIYQTVFQLEDSFDVEGMMESAERHCEISRRVGREILPIFSENSLHLIAGGCRFCKRCAKADGLPCRFPKEALSSLEAYGVDVYEISKTAGLNYINGQNTVTFFSMILFSEDEDV